MDFPPMITEKDGDLPQIESLWKKIKFDLGQGFKVVSRQTHTNHIVRAFTLHEALGWRFLLVASANDTMPPVFSVEMHAYPQGVYTWKLNLKYQPLAEPHWQYNWKTLKNMKDIDEPVGTSQQSEIISAYLQSAFDLEATSDAYNRVGYNDQSASWFGNKNLR